MRAGFGDHHRRRRHPARRRVLQVLLAAGLAGAALAYAYQVGASASAARLAKLEAELGRVEADTLELRDRSAVAVQHAAQLERSLSALRARLAREVPTGAAAELLARIQTRLAAGVEAERLSFLIDAAAEPSACAGEPETKRFSVRTPLSQGPVSAVRFLGRVVVTGRGEPARNPEGLAEAWFDPAAPLELEFRALDGSVASVHGVLPLDHTVLVDGREYRFSVIAGERAFVEVTAQVCELPGGGAQAFDAGSG